MMRHLYCERGTKASTQKGTAVRLVNINSKFDRRQSGNWMHGYPPLTKVSLCYFSLLLRHAFKRSHSRLQKNPIWTFWTCERGVCYTDARPTQVSPRHKLTTEHFKRANVRLWFRDVGPSLHKPVCASHRQRSTNSKTSDSLPLSEPLIQFKEQREVC